jgi:Na+/H+-dicarboxylate symporter
MMVGVLLFPIHQDIIISTIPLESMKSASGVSNHRVAANDFYKLLSREKMLALIIFSFLIGFACLRSGEKGAL